MLKEEAKVINELLLFAFSCNDVIDNFYSANRRKIVNDTFFLTMEVFNYGADNIH